MQANASIIAPMLNGRNPEALQVKFSHMKRKGKLVSVVKEVVAQETKIENDFQTRLVEIIINHAPVDFKEKLFIGMLSKVGSGSGL
jgi:hypothetical protein